MDKLKFINKQMEIIGVPYEFMRWNQPEFYPYFTGEITEEPVTTEDGLEESTLLLTGFHRGSYLELEEIKETIKRRFDPIVGCRAWTENGAIIAFYDGSFTVPTEDASLKKIQINIKIKEWKVK